MNNPQCCLCIRREDKNKWEKRTPLIPSDAELLKNKYGINICVQPSEIRIFKDREYLEKGIELVRHLNKCSIILALKEIPIEFILKDKVYVFFSHTIKGQSHNMPMLKKLIQSNCTLIDYEKITDEKGRRLILFGFQAGQSGMIEALHALGKRLDTKGIKNPFVDLKQPFKYRTLYDAKNEIEKIGSVIKRRGIHPDVVPLICGFSGYGHTSKGAQDIFDILPHQEIKAKDLQWIIKTQQYHNKEVYKVVFQEKDLVQHKDKKNQFELQDYYQNPEDYESIFSKHLPYLTVLINCIYWESKCPKLVTTSDLKKFFGSNENFRLQIIGDISCDIEGSIECTKYITTPENPFFLYDPISEKAKKEMQGRGIAVMSIDNLPAEIPLESSIFFSKTLKPFIPGLAQADFSKDFNDCRLPDPIKRAVILYKGKFTPDYKYMEKFL